MMTQNSRHVKQHDLDGEITHWGGL